MKNKLDTAVLAVLYNESRHIYCETEFLAFSFCDSSGGGVQVTEFGLLEIAPISEWIVTNHESGKYPIEASATKDGVRFFSVMTQAELDKLKEVSDV